MNWVLDSYNENGFLDTCLRASMEDEAFATFRDNPFFGLIVENSPLKSGLEYYECIKNKFPWLLDMMDRFITSDKFGSPKKHKIGYWNVSPSTMRYIKTLGDLQYFFRDILEANPRIAEIGPGYGGLCKIIHDVYYPKEYCLCDQPEPIMLQKRFLKEFGVAPTSHLRKYTESFDIVVAMYSWSELTHDLQREYMNRVMKKSKNLYIMLNYDMEFSYNLIKENFPPECISDHNLFYDDSNMEYYPHNRFIIIKNNPCS